jgi:hypothetical protein
MHSANYALTKHFNYFFNKINPSQSYIQKASSQHRTITNLIEQSPLTQELKPYCFLQGSYDRKTAIYAINDIDIVVLCNALTYTPNQTYYGSGENFYSRDKIFQIIASPLKNDGRYKQKVNYCKTSMCIKLDLGIKVEILPVVRHYSVAETQTDVEPFFLYRPENQQWEEGYARYHQQKLTNKNSKTDGNFIPAIKVFKHLVKHHDLNIVSFHLECLLYSINDNFFQGNPATWITTLLQVISSYNARSWYSCNILTPCKERSLFSDTEWSYKSWIQFYNKVYDWLLIAEKAYKASDRDFAISSWQALLGDNFFSKVVS